MERQKWHPYQGYTNTIEGPTKRIVQYKKLADHVDLVLPDHRLIMVPMIHVQLAFAKYDTYVPEMRLVVEAVNEIRHLESLRAKHNDKHGYPHVRI